MRPPRLWIACALAGAAACSTQLQGLHDAPIDLPTLPPASTAPPVSLLVCRFTDHRGDRFARGTATDFIPYAALFYTSVTAYHLDHSGFMGRRHHGRPQVILGSLTTDLPDLVAAAIQRARPTWKIEVTGSKDRCRTGGDATYVIDGAIRRTELRSHMNVVPLGLLALIGVPHRFVDFVGEFDVEVRHAGTGARAWDHTFKVDERRSIGLYYNRHVAHDLFTALLRDTVATTASGAISLAERGS
jgi:hypothetical protein